MADLSDDDRALLLERLATFTRADPSRFVSARIVLPSADHFPERWEHSEGGMRILAQRMLSHAGLGDLRAEMHLGDSAIDQGRTVFETETALLTVDRDVASFSCDLLGRADDAALSLAQEVARAALCVQRRRAGEGPYRSTTQLLVPTATDDELVDASVLSVHLGLGVLATVGADVARPMTEVSGRIRWGGWHHVTYGALEPNAMSYLLAIQLVARAPDAERLAEILRSLPGERCDEVTAEMSRLDRTVLIDVLGLGPSESWDEEPGLPPPPLPDLAASPGRAPNDDDRRPTFRVREGHAGSGALAGAGLAFCVELGLNVAGVQRQHWVLELIAVVGCSAAIGLLAGNRSAFDACSNCGRRMPDQLSRCPSCARPVVGRIGDRSERLDAEARWIAENRGEAE